MKSLLIPISGTIKRLPIGIGVNHNHSSLMGLFRGNYFNIKRYNPYININIRSSSSSFLSLSPSSSSSSSINQVNEYLKYSSGEIKRGAKTASVKSFNILMFRTRM